MQIEAATDPLKAQLERLFDSMSELRQASPKRKEETSGLIQGTSRAPGHKFDSGTTLFQRIAHKIYL